jgi:hypothetical protein
MKHKWHKEICAWANGAEIEVSMLCQTGHGEWDWSEWTADTNPEWETVEYQYRIKPQPKEPRYAYLYGVGYERQIHLTSPIGMPKNYVYIGKIKLEDEDD